MKQILLLVLLLSSPLFSQEKPKLVVAITIDQFRYDYLTMLEKQFLPATKNSGGFNRLLKNGAVLTEANYTNINTFTAPGHQTFLSGVNLSKSGIIGNDWYARDIKKNIYCVYDSTVSAVGIESSRNAGKMSPKNALVENVCDRLKTASPTSKVIGISFKDRGAILPAGKKATAAYWFDTESGNWITSTYYTNELPSWLIQYNAKKKPEAYLGKKWETLLPKKEYLFTDQALGEGTLIGETEPIFPHLIYDIRTAPDNPLFKRNKVFDVISPTPFGSELTIDVATAVILSENLGKGSATDILCVSLSSLDYCGHVFGNKSHEVQDLILRMDRQFDQFFKFLDQHLGFENCLIVLTADHGVAPLPEQTEGGLRLYEKEFLQTLTTSINSRYPNVIEAFANEEVYLNLKEIADNKYELGEVEKFVGLMAMNQKGVVNYYTRQEMMTLQEALAFDSVGTMVLNAFHPIRSGDVHLVLQPNAFFSYRQTGTTHGSLYEYDTHVPILFVGKGVKTGSFRKRVGVIDIAPTVHRLLGLSESPGTYDGRVLTEILK